MSLPGRTALPQAFFLPTGAGQRFCLFHPAQGDARRGCVLYLHPFAEELNCTRRVVARQARALASAGFGVLQIDLLGCGDSAGDFADATWPAWLSDAQQAHRWLTGHCGGPLWLWGMRSGALLAAQLARLLQNESEPAHLLFWQPVASGQQMLQQFLRLRTAGQWLSAHPADERTGAGAGADHRHCGLHPEPRPGPRPGRSPPAAPTPAPSIPRAIGVVGGVHTRSPRAQPRRRQAPHRLARSGLAGAGTGGQRPGLLANRGHR